MISQVKNPLLLRGMLITACLLAPLKNVSSLETGFFSPPVLDGFALHREDEGDGDGDGTNETHIKHYYNPAGDSIFNMTTKDRLWAWSRSTVKDADDPDSNYVIRDSNCDGMFDERYGLNEEYHIPDCLK
jgi:hypothetical protein